MVLAVLADLTKYHGNLHVCRLPGHGRGANIGVINRSSILNLKGELLIKKAISLLLTLLMSFSLCCPVLASNNAASVTAYPDELSVAFNNGKFEIISHSLFDAKSTSNQTVIDFQKEHDNFYKTTSNLVSQSFRLALENDGTLTPLQAVEIDLADTRPSEILITQYGYSANSQIVKDIESLASISNVDLITAYIAPQNEQILTVSENATNSTTATISTEYLTSEATYPDGGETIVTRGERGVTSSSKMLNEVTLTIDTLGYSGYSMSASRAISSMDLFSMFVEEVINEIMEEWENAPTTDGYMMALPKYRNTVRYTNVIENGMEYLGCVSNSVSPKCKLTFYSAAYNGTDVAGDYVEFATLQSNCYNATAAREAALNNYLVAPLIDKIDYIEIITTYPNDSSSSFSMYVV